MPVQNVIDIAASALGAQSARIALIAQNLANADSVATADGGPYQRRVPIFEAVALDPQASTLDGVKLAAVIPDNAPPRIIHDPSNPLADENGDVKMPAINSALEMVDLLEATRSYEANLSALETARTVALRTLDLLK